MSLRLLEEPSRELFIAFALWIYFLAFLRFYRLFSAPELFDGCSISNDSILVPFFYPVATLCEFCSLVSSKLLAASIVAMSAKLRYSYPLVLIGDASAA